MDGVRFQPLDANSVVHRIGGADVANLRLKPKERTLVPPGFSVFQGGTPDSVRAQVRTEYPLATRLLAQAETVASATVREIRQAGFEVVSDPTRHLENHARLVHPDGLAGFNDANLTELAKVFRVVKGK